MNKKKEYKIWATQGQGEGRYPDATFKTLEEALDFLRSCWGEACFRIEQPDGTNYDLKDWELPTIILVRLNKDIEKLNPRQQHIIEKMKSDMQLKTTLRYLSHRSCNIQHLIDRCYDNDTGEREIIIEMLTWGLLKTVESYPWSLPHNEREYENKKVPWIKRNQPCKDCGAKEGTFVERGFHRCNKCGYSGQ